ncbi:MAG: RsmB/NOP family class I SAM-dependent RNA methyltransferase [Faecalibacterium sp.]|nr:RsmB/NOP family class I SAM-dependent RNA methyltransferase [Faecalibacterium sp.]
MGLEYFTAREKALLGARYKTLLTPPENEAARGITVSALRCTPAEFAAKADFSVSPSPFCAAGFVVKQANFKPGKHPYHAAGVFYAQEPSAASAAPLVGAAPGMRVLDLCAAPGGKSSQLAAALGGQGLLVANEYVPERAEILKQNLERMGVANAVVLNETTARIAAALPAFFDRVLVDAPCSGEGMFRKEPQAAAQHCAALVQQCAALGAAILDDAAAALAPGGVLVYSTCTFAPEEDEGQIGAFLARHPEFTLLPALENAPSLFGSEGEENRCGAYPFDVRLVRRIWPCQGGEGHFLARLQKAGTARILPPKGSRTAEENAWLAALCGTKKELRRPEKRRPEKRGKGAPETAGAAAVLAAWQAFAAESFPALQAMPAAVRGENVLLPPAFAPVGLHILRAGVLAGSVQKGRFVPAHHLFTAFGAGCPNQESLTRDDPRTTAYLHGEEIAAQTAQNGWCCVSVDGYPLGGGKVSGGRVKNHYPKALRLL